MLSPDAYIARQNVQRQNVDVAYLITLSDDALPSLVDARERLVDPLYLHRSDVLAYRRSRLVPSESWLTWNLGRARTRAALAQLPE